MPPTLPSATMPAPLNKLLLVSISGGALITPVLANIPAPPLQQKLEALQCTTDASVAKTLLSELRNINAPGQRWPDEWLGQKPEPSLHAGILDIALNTLKSTAERFPDLREEAERIALGWDYCEVTENQGFHDLILRNHKVQKSLAAENTPLKWDGFRQWGFLTPDPAKRFVPRLLDEIRIAPSAYHLFLHQAYRQRCFPHPETGLLVREAETPTAAVANHALPLSSAATEPEAQPYPFKWDPTCTIAKADTPEKASPVPTLTKATPTPTNPHKSGTQRKASKTQATSKPMPTQQPVRAAPTVATAPVPTLPAAGAKGETGKPQAAAQFQRSSKTPTRPADKQAKPKQVVSAHSGEVILPTIVTTHSGGDIPIYFDVPVTEQAHSTTGIVGGKKKQRRIAVNVADSVSLKNGSNTLGVSASWSPKENWFVNGSMSVKDGKPGYSWNVGYANPKPGTLSAQIGNYGPITPGDGLDLAHASASVGYKVDSATLAKHKLSASTGLNVSGKGKVSANATVQWNPKPHIYARTTASVAEDSSKPGWSYSVGYANPKPGGWRVEYSNYGNNDFPGDNLKDGAVTVSRGWQF